MSGGAPKPEGLVPPDMHYDSLEAQRYHTSTRNVDIQRQLTERCIELLELEKTSVTTHPLVLDIGCGSGLSAQVLREHGLPFVGVDIATDMLAIAATEQPAADFLRLDIGEPQHLTSGVFDAAISVSVVQWLCHAFTNDQEPKRRLRQFFQWLYNSLAKTGRAVFQFYPSHQQQTESICKAASQVGFSTFLLFDNPESIKRKKAFLICTIGQPEADSMVGASLGPAPSQRGKRKKETRKDWVVRKKEKRREHGLPTKADSKYTARKRQDRV